MRAIDRHVSEDNVFCGIKKLTCIMTQSTNANLQPNSMSQVLAISVLSRWGHDGFMTHTRQVSELYRARRDVFEAALRRHLDGLVEWTSPESGMFIW